MRTHAVVLTRPRDLALAELTLASPSDTDIVVDIAWSGISTGTERLFYTGEMPPFPGMGYPLVPGYEAAGEVVAAGPESGLDVGDHVFVPGANCYHDAYGLFGGAARRLVTDGRRAIRIDAALGREGALMALAATARHAVAGPHAERPDLIVGHGVLGRLMARLCVADGGPAPTVWEVDPDRRSGAAGYEVIDPETDTRRDYAAIYDASGDASLIDTLIGRLARGGVLTLAGFYSTDIRLAFPTAFMKEARLRVAAEWTRDDLEATRALVETGALSLGGLVTHSATAADAAAAYATAFGDPACLKMMLDWKDMA
ncbi:2-desacetyl-2-hydroxyethyl bacteriochlorophyllide A dehydrogenase BchC [Roseivivax marinus]|uniref:2-desacetyl-2-hydroxyethyl bacteriochlorophyllide A dehydrogenase BchC n=1 Tax=Roseivivax marinus TaxID=1379903 RepID=W4HII3_9RHOB|nr:chlorophyll synthesis pathway protein BchC [Roseivivax marinus]ETW12223.1 2-desacetyl-2-hydroxyethyl bacteriochlorophyllide A dehydrogenase BchC [Roseivivax marinus]